MKGKMYKRASVWLLVIACGFGVLSACQYKKEPQASEKEGIGPHAVQETKPFKINEAVDAPEWEKTSDAIIAEGVSYMGTPYVFGAERFNDKAFDCSSYVQYLYGKQGIELGYNSREQAVQGEEISFINLRKGDLMFFSDEDFPNETGLNKVRHVGIYMGDGKILHTYEQGIGVIISNIHKDQKEGEYWYEHYLFARRVVPG
ncbi:C40 family peptidase [Paenibacillus spongiae]|uniref:C40 family peptidase n=1 Tax=Paenibacillus spongiae TaxID=2909671 RepID=A0ABY5S954_9BACL|nr:C40 family peptidase [Paenibacillus spongiae]UVI29253.1 C40 family peptidase [Paenibacillus spongiae]